MPLRLSLLLILLAVAGCEDESDPVDIPFEGVDHADVRDSRPKPAVVPAASASTSASATATNKTAPGTGAAAKVQACCGALYARSRTAKDEGTQAVNRQAASVCSRLAAQVSQGKLSSANALSRVRSSLLGTPPAACR